MTQIYRLSSNKSKLTKILQKLLLEYVKMVYIGFCCEKPMFDKLGKKDWWSLESLESLLPETQFVLYCLWKCNFEKTFWKLILPSRQQALGRVWIFKLFTLKIKTKHNIWMGFKPIKPDINQTRNEAEICFRINSDQKPE